MATVPGAPIVQPRPLTQSQQLEFFWATPSSDGGDPITSYVITDGTTSNTLVDGARNFRATGLVNGTVYQYRVAASNSIGLGPYSFFRAVQPGLTPGLPTNVAASNVNGLRYEISWNNPTDTGQASLQRGFLQAFPLDSGGNTLSTTTFSSFIVSRSVWGGNAGDSNSRILELFSNYNYKVLVRVMNDPGFSLPITYTSTIFTAPFSPDGIAALRLWLDATNSSNFTLSSTSFVSTWTDKSPNAYTVSQTTSSNFPTFSTNFVTFSTFQHLNLPQAAINNVSTWTMMFYFVPKSTYAFINAKQHDANNTYNLISYGATTNSSGAVIGGLSTTMYIHTSNGGSTINYPIGFSTNTINLVEMRYDGQSNLSLWNNGFLWSTIRGDFRLANITNATNGTLGALIQSNAFRLPSTSAFSLGSFLFYSTIVEASTMYKLQGYLSWQYGLQSNLPTNHPYFSVQPTTNDSQLEFSPSSISSMQLWLDANDATTITLSTTASTVTQWRDKSGQGRHAIPFQGQPFYSNTALTGNLPGIVFSNASTLYAPASPNTFPSSIHAFVIFQKTGAAVATNETVVARSLSNQPAPFDVYDTTRLFGNGSGVGGGSFSSALNIKSATSVNNWSYTVTSNFAQEFWQGSTVNQSLGGTNRYGDAASNIWFGTRADSATAYRGVISESLFYSSILTFGERQAIEGYLAWKWGVQSSLIINHPFRFQPPTSRSLYEGSNGSLQFSNANNNSSIVVQRDADFNFGSNDFTFEWWQNSPQSQDVWGFGDSPNSDLYVATGTTTASILVNNTQGNIQFTVPTSIPTLLNAWHHIAIVKSTNVMRAFFNGMSSPTQSNTISSILSTSTRHLNLPFTSFRGNIGDFHICRGRALYWASNFIPPSSIQSNVSTLLLIKPTTLGRSQLDKGPLNKTVWSFAPVTWTPNSYPDFVQSYGTLLNTSGANYVRTGMDNDLRLRTGDFTIEYYFNATADNNRPWGLGAYNNPGDSYMDCEYLGGGATWAIRFDSFPPNFNVGYSLIRNSIGSWNHYAFTRSGTTCRAFQNGTLLGTNTSGFDFNPTSVTWNVGGQPGYTGAGYITNYHIVKGVALYTSSFIPPTIPIQSTASTVVLMRFASSLTVDSGPLNKTLTSVGSPSWYLVTNTRR